MRYSQNEPWDTLGKLWNKFRETMGCNQNTLWDVFRQTRDEFQVKYNKIQSK